VQPHPAASALATILVAALLATAGCCSCGAPASFTARKALPPGAEQGPGPMAPPALRVLLLGDFGARTCQQEAVARAVAAAHAQAPFDLVFSAGDNLYECGPDPRRPGAEACRFGPDDATPSSAFVPPEDPRFDALFESRLPALERGGAPVPVYLALGNHDVASWVGCREGSLAPDALSRLRACLETAHRGPRWRMPARHYVVDRGPARFIVLDSNLLLGPYGGFTLEGEERFLRGAAEGCERRACFVVAHHPTASAGKHRVEMTPEYRERVRRLQEAAGPHLAAWICGHDHDLQHLRAGAGYDVLVSGNGSRARPSERFAEASPAGAQLFFASTAWGFASLEVGERAWLARFESTEGEPLHCCRAEIPGPCQPVACPPPRAAGAAPGPAR
jgi:hypothetical protein